MTEQPSRRFKAALKITGATPLNPPAKYGPFYCHAQIAKGGQGTVYLATGDAQGRAKPCVIKVFNDRDPHTIARARRSLQTQMGLAEARYATSSLSLSPPLVPDILACDLEAENGPWVAQEFRGVNLRSYINNMLASNEGRHPVGLHKDPARALFQRIVTRVDHVHRLGVLHRDLKPGNVLVETPGPADRLPDPSHKPVRWERHFKVTLCDFDLAKGEGQTTLTQTGAGFGTPGYTAPEQFLGEKATTASDVYSLAMVAIFLVTGREPNDQVLIGSDPWNKALSPDVAEQVGDMSDWIQRAVSFNPMDRPSLRELTPAWPLGRPR